MPESLASWLALREPADVAARSARLTDAILDSLARHRTLRVLDLGTGTGSNVRYLADQIHVPQRWLLVDRDPAVLRELPPRIALWGASRGYVVGLDGNDLVVQSPDIDCRIETRVTDLGGPPDRRMFFGRHLVTASALLDLVSEAWLRALAACCRENGAAVLFALTYTGGSVCFPGEPEDDEIRDLLNRHQKMSDKGFGAAAGPDAFQAAVRSFAEIGYEVRHDASAWRLSPDAKPLQRLLIKGWADAALELEPGKATMIRDWLKRRLAHVEDGGSHIIVSHQDLAAWLPEDEAGGH
jgi:hypothetical protein